LNRIEPDKAKQYWERLHNELKGKNLEIETWSLKGRSGHFYARSVSDRIFIEGKGIKGVRTIAFPEFEKAAKYYNDYIDDVASVKQKMRDDVGYNTPYILTLIHHVLEDAPEILEPEPEPPKKPQRTVYYRSRKRY